MVGVRIIWLLLAAARAFAPSHRQARRASSTIRHGLPKNLDPILTAELLYTLRRAGHGDVIVVSPTASNEKSALSSRLEMQEINPIVQPTVLGRSSANFRPSRWRRDNNGRSDHAGRRGLPSGARRDRLVAPSTSSSTIRCSSCALRRASRLPAGPSAVVGPPSTLSCTQELLRSPRRNPTTRRLRSAALRCGVEAVDRFAFYEARSAFAVVQCASPGPDGRPSWT